MRPIVWMTVVLAVASGGAFAEAPAAGQTPGDEKAVLAVVDRFMTAISTGDFEGLAKIQTSDGVTYRAKVAADGGVEVTARPNAYWSDPARNDGRTLQERYWTPTVLMRGPIAVVWAPYEFKVDGKTSHCGIDVFNLVKIDGAWRIGNAMWTVEPDACAGLRPSDATQIRPGN